MTNKKQVIVHSKKKKNAKKHRKLSKFGVTIIITCIMLGGVSVSFGVYKLMDISQQKALIPALTPGKNGVSTPDAADDAAGATVKKESTLTSEEIQKLHELGYTDDTISLQPTVSWYQILYGSQRYIQEAYMSRYKSPYTKAQEPNDEQRSNLLAQMTTLYTEGDYEGVVKNFQSALRTQTFEIYKDEPITSLYHDALSKIQSLNENSTATYEEDDDEKDINKAVLDLPDSLSNNRNLINTSLDTHYSAIALLYDAFNFNTSLIASHISDNNSCVPINPLEFVSNPDVYDMHKLDTQQNSDLKPVSAVPHKESISPQADLVYVYTCTDNDNNKLTVVIQSIEIRKEIVGIYYENPDVCLYKHSISN